MLGRLESKLDSVGDRMARQTRKPVLDAMQAHDMAREKEQQVKKQEAANLREEMERRK